MTARVYALATVLLFVQVSNGFVHKPLSCFSSFHGGILQRNSFVNKRGFMKPGKKRIETFLRLNSEAPTSTSETHQFKAEVSRVMDIIIHSLYQDKDVFLRELVSNAADACDKQRFHLLTNSGGINSELKIRVTGDSVKNTLTIEDNGIGMTKHELMNNLGRIAESGSKRFMEALKMNQNGEKAQDVNLIGQFGVGFYSGYLVADKITVISRSAKEEDGRVQWVWESNAGNSYTLRSEPVSEEMGSGTKIILQLKEEYDEYAGEFKLRDMLKKYSSFVSFPIELWSEKTDYQSPDKESTTAEDAMKSVPVKSFQFERINNQQPIWMRPPKSVNHSEYLEFYKSTFKCYDEPMSLSHFALEGQVDFKALLFVPTVLPYELTKDMFSEQSKAMKLYVKRVFINDKFDELMPRWLTFVRGIVDSEDLPLNVGREILQKSKMLAVINKKLVRKSVDMFHSIAKEGYEKYEKFWKIFGKYIKVGMVEDDVHKDELATLYRTWTSKSNDGLISLSDYVDRMQPNQTKIYYVTGDGKEVAARSPVLETLKDRNIEVIYLAEPLDELAFQSISNFQGKLLVDAAKGEQDASGVEGSDAKAKKEHQKELSMLCDWLQDKLGVGEISKVDVSTRLTSSPAALVQGAYGMSPTMQRYMKAQAAASGQSGVSGRMENLNKVTLELNPKHPIVLKLNEMVKSKPLEKATLTYATLLYEVASLASGYQLQDPSSFAIRVNSLMESLSLSSGADNDSSEEGSTSSHPEKVEAEVVS